MDQSCPLKKEDNVAEHDVKISQTRPVQKEDIKKEAAEDQELDVKDPELSSEEIAFLSVLKSSTMPLDENLLSNHFPHRNIDWASGLGLLASNIEEDEAPMGHIEEETKGSLWSGWLADSCDLCVYSEVFNLSPATRYILISIISIACFIVFKASFLCLTGQLSSRVPALSNNPSHKQILRE
jgi:hypothetical protein